MDVFTIISAEKLPHFPGKGKKQDADVLDSTHWLFHLHCYCYGNVLLAVERKGLI